MTLTSGQRRVGTASLSDTLTKRLYAEDAYHSLRRVPNPCVHELPTACEHQDGGEGKQNGSPTVRFIREIHALLTPITQTVM